MKKDATPARIKSEQIKTIVESGYEPPVATLSFNSTQNDNFFTVDFRLSTGIDALFVGARNEPRRFYNVIAFFRLAHKMGIKVVKFNDVLTSEIQFGKDDSAEEGDSATT